MTPLFEAALELQSFFARRQWQFCLIGGIALLRWGEPRFTRDVDETARRPHRYRTRWAAGWL